MEMSRPLPRPLPGLWPPPSRQPATPWWCRAGEGVSVVPACVHPAQAWSRPLLVLVTSGTPWYRATAALPLLPAGHLSPVLSGLPRVASRSPCPGSRALSSAATAWTPGLQGVMAGVWSMQVEILGNRQSGSRVPSGSCLASSGTSTAGFQQVGRVDPGHCLDCLPVAEGPAFSLVTRPMPP